MSAVCTLRTCLLAGLALALAPAAPAEPLELKDTQRLVDALEEAGLGPGEAREILREQRDSGADLESSEARVDDLIARVQRRQSGTDEPDLGETIAEQGATRRAGDSSMRDEERGREARKEPKEDGKDGDEAPPPASGLLERAAQDMQDLQDTWAMHSTLLSGEVSALEPILGFLEGLDSTSIFEYSSYIDMAIIRLRGLALVRMGDGNGEAFHELSSRAEGLKRAKLEAVAARAAAFAAYGKAVREARSMPRGERQAALQEARAALQESTTPPKGLRSQAAQAVRSSWKKLQEQPNAPPAVSEPTEPPAPRPANGGAGAGPSEPPPSGNSPAAPEADEDSTPSEPSEDQEPDDATGDDGADAEGEDSGSEDGDSSQDGASDEDEDEASDGESEEGSEAGEDSDDSEGSEGDEDPEDEEDSEESEGSEDDEDPEDEDAGDDEPRDEDPPEDER